MFKHRNERKGVNFVISLLTINITNHLTSQVSRSSSRSNASAVPPASLSIASSRPTSSSKFVGGKATENAALPKPKKPSKKPVKTVAKAKESELSIVEDSEPERTIGGMEEEDDTVEKEAALASPMKGSESRRAAKVCIAPHKMT